MGGRLRSGLEYARTPLSLTWWIAIIGLVFLVRVLFVFTLMPQSALVPDESTYVYALQGLIRGADIVQIGNELGYGPSIFTGSWLLLRPAQFLVHLGLGPWEALRLASLLLSVLATVLATTVIFRSRLSNSKMSGDQRVAVVSATGAALLVLILLPSQLVWGVLVLRESSAVLSMVLAAWGLSLVFARPTAITRVLGLLAIFTGVAAMYMSRSYLSLVLSAAIVLAAFFPPLRGRSLVALALAIAVVLGNYVGAEVRAFTPGTKFDYTSPPVAAVVARTTPEDSLNPTAAAPESEPRRLPGPQSSADAQSEVLAIVDSRVSNFYVTREGLREGADSAFPFNYCAAASGSIETLSCEALYLPLGAYRFLLTPNLLETGVDVPVQRLAAGVENIIWLLIFIAALATVGARRSASPRMTIFLVALLTLSTAAYALVSGNEGTAFRHKGQFLWAWCLIIALGYGWRPWVASLGSRDRSGAAS